MAEHGNDIKPSETVELFEKYDDSADIVLRISGKKLYCHALFLNKISPTFCKMVQMARSKSTVAQVEIKLANDVPYIDMMNILKFYYPNISFDFNGKDVDVLVSLFETCHRFDCKKMKYVIYNYLDKENNLKVYLKQRFGQPSWFPSQFMRMASTVVSPEMKWIITSPDVLSSVTVCNKKYSYNEIAESKLKTDMKFEIFIWIFESLHKAQTKRQHDNEYLNELKDVETTAIVNFLKIYFYDNRTADLSFSKTLKNEEINRFYPEILPTSPPGDCKIVVENQTFAASSAALSVASPVFNAMLNLPFKEAAEKVITLPGKNREDIIDLMNHLHQPLEIDEKSNIFGLLPLCQEYQIDWLTEKIRKYMEISLSPSLKFPVILNYLNAAENYGFPSLKDKIFEIGCCSNFIRLQMTEEFSFLSNETQVEFVCKTIVTSTVNAIFAEHLWLVLKEHHSTLM